MQDRTDDFWSSDDICRHVLQSHNVRLSPQFAKKCTKQQPWLKPHSKIREETDKAWTPRPPGSVSNNYSARILSESFQNLSVCSKDKAWEMAAREKRVRMRGGGKGRWKCQLRLLSRRVWLFRERRQLHWECARKALNGCQLSRPTMFLNNTLTTCRLLKSH